MADPITSSKLAEGFPDGDGGARLTSTNVGSKVYKSLPPVYPPICGIGALQKGITNNLMSHYVSMSAVERGDTSDFGNVLSLGEVKQFFG